MYLKLDMSGTNSIVDNVAASHRRHFSLPALRTENEMDACTKQVKQHVSDKRSLAWPTAPPPVIGMYHDTLAKLKILRDRLIYLIIKARVLGEACENYNDSGLNRRYLSCKAKIEAFLTSDLLLEYDTDLLTNTAIAGAEHIVNTPEFRDAVSRGGPFAVTNELVQILLEALYKATGV